MVRTSVKKAILCLGVMSLLLSGCRTGQSQSSLEKQTIDSNTQKERKNQVKDEKEVWIENPIPREEKTVIGGEEQMSNAEREIYINTISSSEPLNLTTQQKLEDFDFFWNTIQDKAYCLDEYFEKHGIDLEEYILSFRKRVEESENDYEFWEALNDSAQMCTGYWHIGLNSPYWSMTAGLTLSDESDTIKSTGKDEKSSILKYWDVLLSQNSYQYKSSRQQRIPAEPMPKLKIIDEKTAVITIPTFAYNSQREEAGKMLIEYMKQVSDYENVILDLQGNRGGNDTFVYYNLIAPNIDEIITKVGLRFFKMSNDIMEANLISRVGSEPKRYRIGYEEEVVYGSAPISQLPEELQVENSDYGNADYFIRNDKIIFPRFNHKILKGKIWVLTYSENYSAAETFVSFCKSTGFAVLVGKQTKGDGGGGQPLWFSLPNSRLEGSVTSLWRLNEDGTNNIEEGTKPDIESPKGETPLETCMKMIK